MSMHVSFPGGMSVMAEYKGFRIRTDQPPETGGGGSAPSPFDLFLASIATCAGFYALRFCQERKLSTEGLELDLHVEKEPETGQVTRIRLDLIVPEDFPGKYFDAILRVVDHCAVKRHLAAPPRFEMAVHERAAATA